VPIYFILESLLSYKKSTLLAKLDSTTAGDHGSERPPTEGLRTLTGRVEDTDMDVEFMAFQASVS